MEAIVAIAEEAAQRAGELIVSLLGNVLVERKGESYNLVTAADRQAEAVIIDCLRTAMPGCAILSEESLSETDLSADRLWIVDPLDGTTNFAHGIPHFGVSAAYAEKGELIAGVVCDPMRKELFSAYKDGGAYCNGERIMFRKTRRWNNRSSARVFFTTAMR